MIAIMSLLKIVKLLVIQLRKYPKPNRHWNPMFRKLREQKFIKVDLPDFKNLHYPDKMTPEEIRTSLKKQGIPPMRPWRERPIFISCTGDIIDAYKPLEGDGKSSFIHRVTSLPTKQGVKDSLAAKETRAVSKIRQYDRDFAPKEFAAKAQQIFIDVHNALQQRDEDRLHELVTEYAFPVLWNELELRSIRWKWVETVEPARTLQTRCTEMLQANLYAQLTVRLHSKQILAIYDQFGRLMLGDEKVARDVVDYVVFERHLMDKYADWRLHARITPDWAPQRQAVYKTFEKIESKNKELSAEQQVAASTA